MTKQSDSKLLPAPPATTTRFMRQLGERASAGLGPTLSATSDPCMWMHTSEIEGGRWRGNNNRRPSVAHHAALGDKGERIVDERTRGRYREMIDRHGHLVYAVHTCGAAHVTEIIDGKFSRDAYTQACIDKALALGWFDVNAGCLLRQLARGLVRGDRLLVDLKGERMCPVGSKSCRHQKAERAARQAKNKRIQDARELAMQSEEKKTGDATRALTEQIAALVLRLAEKEAK